MQLRVAPSGADVVTVRRQDVTICRQAAARHTHHPPPRFSRSAPPTSARAGIPAAQLTRSSCAGLRSPTSASTDRPTAATLIVHEDLAAEVVAIFEQLLQLRYPIEKIRTVDNYPGADDELSMEDNNTSAFNCRDIPGTGRWSQHAFGRAIDVNPLLNPEIDRTGAIQPKTAAPYLDRNRTDPGILHAGDAVVRVFTDRGWRWGGDWRSPIDYQHFER